MSAQQTGKADNGTSPAGTAKDAPKSVLERAKEHFKAARYQESEQLLRDSLQAQPNGPDAAESYFLLGQTQGKQGGVDHALRTYSGLITRYPQSELAAQALEEQALLYIQRRNPSEAQKNRDLLLARYPASPTTARVWTGVADQLFDEKKFKEAVAIYQVLKASLTPQSAQTFAIAKALVEGDGDPAKLLPLAQQALDDNRLAIAKPLFEYLSQSPRAVRHLPQIKTKLGWCLYLESNDAGREAAEKLWKEVVRQTLPPNPWYAESCWHLVQLAAGPKRDLKGAVAMCDQIVKVQPVGSFPHEQALFSKAWLLTVHDQGKAAVAAFEDLAADYPEKMKQPPIQLHVKRAQESAAKKAGGAK